MPKISQTRSRPWGEGALRALHRGSAKKTPILALSQQLKRTIGALRQKARSEGLSLGEFQRGVSTSRLKYRARARLGLPSTL